MVPFTLLARSACTSHASLALALTAEFAAVDHRAADLVLDDLALGLRPTRGEAPLDELRAVAEVAGAELETVVLHSAIDDLLFDRVLVGRAGHPLLLAIACSEAGRRAGLPLGIVAGSGGAFVAHTQLPDPLLVDPSTARIVDARTLTFEVAWQCSHQIAARVLNRLGERADRIGNVTWSLRAAELRLALPFADSARERLEADLRRVRARLN